MSFDLVIIPAHLIRPRWPGLRHVFAYAGYSRPKLKAARGGSSGWTIEII